MGGLHVGGGGFLATLPVVPVFRVLLGPTLRGLFLGLGMGLGMGLGCATPLATLGIAGLGSDCVGMLGSARC